MHRRRITWATIVMLAIIVSVSGCSPRSPLVMSVSQSGESPVVPIVADFVVDMRCVYEPSPLWSPADARLVALTRDAQPPVILLDALNGTTRRVPVDEPGGTLLAAWTTDGSRLTIAVPVIDDPKSWPGDHRIVTVDPTSGEEVESYSISDLPNAPDLFNPLGIRWLDSQSFLLMDHRGTGLDSLSLYDLSEGTWQSLGYITRRYEAVDRLIAFELWKSGGTRVGAVDLGSSSQAIWFDESGTQRLDQLSPHGVVITTRDTSGSSRLGLWRPFNTTATSHGTVIRREMESLRPGTGWGAINRAGTMLACLEIQERERSDGQLSLLVFEGRDRKERVRLVLGEIPEKKIAGERLDSQWLSSRRPVWSPSGDRLAVLDCAGSLWLLDTSNASLHLLISSLAVSSLATEEVKLEWSDDGRFLAVVHNPGVGDTRLIVVDTSGV